MGLTIDIILCYAILSMVLLTILTTVWLITRKSRDERVCVGVIVLKVCVIKRL